MERQLYELTINNKALIVQHPLRIYFLVLVCYIFNNKKSVWLWVKFDDIFIEIEKQT